MQQKQRPVALFLMELNVLKIMLLNITRSLKVNISRESKTLAKAIHIQCIDCGFSLREQLKKSYHYQRIPCLVYNMVSICDG